MLESFFITIGGFLGMNLLNIFWLKMGALCLAGYFAIEFFLED